MNIDDLFSDTSVISTADVARAFELSEADARAWADELEVAKIGASYAWVQSDVEALSDKLDGLEAESDDGDGDEEEEEEPDE